MSSLSRTSCTELKWGDLEVELSGGRREDESSWFTEELLKHRNCSVASALWHMAYLCSCLGAVAAMQQVRTASLPCRGDFLEFTSSLKTEIATWVSLSSTSRQIPLTLLGIKL